jgi:hypothetical protein
MRMSLILVIFLLFAGCGCCYADQPADENAVEIPNLVGHWIVETKGAVLMKGDQVGEYTHHEGKFSTLTANAEITEQEGRVLYCDFSSDKGLNETLIGVIGLDNKTVHFADMDGFAMCEIISEDLMHAIYSHVNDHDSVVASGTWTRVR